MSFLVISHKIILYLIQNFKRFKFEKLEYLNFGNQYIIYIIHCHINNMLIYKFMSFLVNTHKIILY